MSCVVPSTAGTESVAKTMSLNLKNRKKSSQCGNIDKNTHTFEQGAVNAMLLSYVSSEGLSLKGLP